MRPPIAGPNDAKMQVGHGRYLLSRRDDTSDFFPGSSFVLRFAFAAERADRADHRPAAAEKDPQDSVAGRATTCRRRWLNRDGALRRPPGPTAEVPRSDDQAPRHHKSVPTSGHATSSRIWRLRTQLCRLRRVAI